MGRKNSDDAVASRRCSVASFYLSGMTQAEIASRLNLTQQQISLDIKAIRKNWMESSIRDFDAIKAEQLAKIDNLEREAWIAWNASREDAVAIKQFEVDGVSRYETVTKGQSGDPRFLQIIQDCIRERLKIIGAYSAERREHSGSVDLAVDVGQLKREVIRELIENGEDAN